MEVLLPSCLCSFGYIGCLRDSWGEEILNVLLAQVGELYTGFPGGVVGLHYTLLNSTETILRWEVSEQVHLCHLGAVMKGGACLYNMACPSRFMLKVPTA